jgi:glycosyltransferase involved in cell wall biosynthesis
MTNLGKLRIVVASSGLGHVVRGIEAWASDLAGALAGRGLEVALCKGGGSPERPFEVVLPCWQRDTAGTKRLLRLLPRRLTWRVGLGSPYDVEQITFTSHLLRFLRRERADVLHVQDPLVAILAQRARRAGLIRARTILAHGTEESPAFLRKFDFVQHLAPWHLEQTLRAGVQKPAWTAIPNFIDAQLFAPDRADDLRAELGIPLDAIVVLCAAAIKRHHKRVDYVVREFAWLRSEQSDLPAWLIVAGGREKETDEVIALGRELLGKHVRFLVRFPRSRMPELYRAADIFCLGSLLEMMPIALLEATASGLPCLVNRHPVMEWMVGPGGAAIDMAVDGSLADALGQLVHSPSQRERLGALARAHCVRHFARDAVVDQILAYYEHAAGRPAAARERPTCV